MTEAGATTRGTTRWKIVLGVLVLLIGGGFLGVRMLLDPQRVSDFLLDRAGTALGLEISVSEPAGIGLLPHLAIELSGVSARAPGDEEVLFSAGFVEIALPWSSLRSEHFEVSSLRLDQAILNLGAFQRWRTATASSDIGPPAPLQLPPFDAPLRIRDGRIVASDWRIIGIEASASPLLEAEPFSMELSARLERGEVPQDFELRLDLLPRNTADGLQLDALKLVATQPKLVFEGSAQLSPPLHLALAGELLFQHWPEGIPQTLPDDGSDTGYRLKIDASSDLDGRGQADLQLVRGHESIAGKLESGALLDWLANPEGRALPPLGGNLEADRLQLQGVELKGVRIQIDAGEAEDADPAQ